MPELAEISQIGAVSTSRRRGGRRVASPRERKVRGTKPPKGEALKYLRHMMTLIDAMKAVTVRHLAPFTGDASPVVPPPSGAAESLGGALEAIERELAALQVAAVAIATDFVSGTNDEQSRRFYKNLEMVIGVDLEGVVADEGLGEILALSAKENVSLIKSIPGQYFSQIEGMVYRNTLSGTPGGMQAELFDLWDITENRAKLIARDQTAKLTANLNQQRNMNLGIEEYIWRTGKDVRVRKEHAKLEGTRHRWDEPPVTVTTGKRAGERNNPGEDIQCRCYAEPIIPPTLPRA